MAEERLAVWLDYVCDQNAPSKPETKLVRIPNDQTAREAMLMELWEECFDAQGGEELMFGFGEHNQKEYCDLFVSDGDDNYILLTYVEIP